MTSHSSQTKMKAPVSHSLHKQHRSNSQAEPSTMSSVSQRHLRILKCTWLSPEINQEHKPTAEISLLPTVKSPPIHRTKPTVETSLLPTIKSPPIHHLQAKDRGRSRHHVKSLPKICQLRLQRDHHRLIVSTLSGVTPRISGIFGSLMQANPRYPSILLLLQPLIPQIAVHVYAESNTGTRFKQHNTRPRKFASEFIRTFADHLQHQSVVLNTWLPSSTRSVTTCSSIRLQINRRQR